MAGDPKYFDFLADLGKVMMKVLLLSNHVQDGSTSLETSSTSKVLRPYMTKKVTTEAAIGQSRFTRLVPDLQVATSWSSK